MLNGETKRKIQSLRDTLVGKLPAPTDQVKQITLGLIYKFMSDIDKENVDLLGGKSFFNGEFEKYSWENILDPSISSYERVIRYSEGLDKMNLNPNIPQLFRNIFKGAYLPYRDPAILTQFLKEIDLGFKYEHSEDLGDAFELLLSIMGSQGAAGQFRTPRHIIDFIVKVVEPNKNDRILDPACGTAGFLISSYKYILKNNKADDSDKPGSGLTLTEKNKLTENFTGYDISPDMVSLSLVNMYLHNFANPNIKEYDTLTNDDLWDEDFDCIMANPPFMTPKGGIRPHKRFAIQANRSELLFVDYIAEHLLPNGKAGVIVPEGIIFQSSNAYKALRRMLVEDNYLYAVVSLPAGVFQPYAGVKTSILFMDNVLACKTDNILFVKIDNDGFDLGAQRRDIDKNDLPLATEIILRYKKCLIKNEEFQLKETEKKIINIVKKQKIKESGDYNLTGERYKEIESTSSLYSKVEIQEVCKTSSGDSAPQGDKYFIDGIYPFVRMSDVGSVHVSNNLIDSKDKINDIAVKSLKLTKWPKKTILFPKSGASIFLNHRVMLGIDAYVSSHLATIVADENKLLPSFLYYILLNIDAKNIINDSNYPSLKISDIGKIKIPLPSLEIQQEIVKELNEYQKIIDGARQVVGNYKPIIKIDPNWKIHVIGEMCDLMTGGTPLSTVKEYYNDDIKWLVSGDIHLGEIYDCPNRISLKGLENSNAKYLPIDSVLIALNGQGKTRGTVALLKTEATCNQSIVSINPKDRNQLNPKYLYYLLKGMYSQIRDLTGDNQRSGLNMEIIKKIKIPLPQTIIQEQIINQIDKELELIKSSKQLIDIFEEKTKDNISRMWEK